MHTYNHWISNTEKPITAKAFTYTIWFPELGLRYIGYKTINSRSNCFTYKSSSRPVKKLISKGNTAVYRIVKWFDDSDDAHKEEIAAMTFYDVTHRSEYLNQSIGGVKFGGPKSTETRAKLSAANKGKTLSDETRAKISEANFIGLYITPLGTFRTSKNASIAHSCAPLTIRNRCKSTSPQFDNWAFFKY